MSDGLDVIVVDDDKGICDIIKELVESFYSWGEVISFSSADRRALASATTSTSLGN